MRTKRMEDLAMIPIFGNQAFKLKRLEMIKEEDFDQWEKLEKALYYQIARSLIEEEMEAFDRSADQKGFRDLLRNRYETFLAQSNVETRPMHMVNTLLQLFEIAEHEEGEGQGKKYLMESLKWIGKISREDQHQLCELLTEKFENHGEILSLFQSQMLGVWNEGDMLLITLYALEALAKEGRINESEFISIAQATEKYLRDVNHQEYVMRLTTHIVQLAKGHDASPETKELFWRRAFEAAIDYQEPYTKMLMAVLIGDQMMEQKNWAATQYFLQSIDEVTGRYGEELTFGDNYKQITEAIEKMREALMTCGYDESLE